MAVTAVRKSSAKTKNEKVNESEITHTYNSCVGPLGTEKHVRLWHPDGPDHEYHRERNSI